MTQAGLVAELVADSRRPIRVVVQETGVSKELVHHYLRQGLLPKSEVRALYDDQQVRLLRQIRLLREDHHLPLDTIRHLFEVFDFDPLRIEALTICDSLSTRITKFAAEGELLSPETLTAEQLVSSAGITRERLAEYVDARMLAPADHDGEQRFSIYDANVIALSERGAELGVTFEWFRTIASYVRVAFDLAHDAFFGPTGQLDTDSDRALADFFVRREVADNFVVNVLHSLTRSRIRELLVQPRPWRELHRLDDVVFRPSASFIQKHELLRHVEQARSALGESPDEARAWSRVGELLLDIGSYDEATFFIREGLERWPVDPALRFALGKVLVLSGEFEKGQRELAQALEAGSDDPRCAAFSALAMLAHGSAAERPETLIVNSAPLLEMVERALAPSPRPHEGDDLEARMLCGWLLASLPPLFGSAERGLGLLLETRTRLESCSELCRTPGLRERLSINTAYLLFDCQTRAGGAVALNTSPRLPDVEELSAEICRLDPQSSFAETAFLRKPKYE